MRRFDLVVVHDHSVTWSIINWLWDGSKWKVVGAPRASVMTVVWDREVVLLALESAPKPWLSVMAFVSHGMPFPDGVVLFNGCDARFPIRDRLGFAEAVYESITAVGAMEALALHVAVHGVHEG